MDGIFSFLKPPGITSHDAVGICRRILKEKRIGHSGTLDPLAYGVLPIFVGKATRLIEYTSNFDKTYVAEGQFGSFTDTEDSTGNPVGTLINSDIKVPTMAELEAVCASFLGSSQQKPSIYSAIKINGVRAYELARAGKAVDLPSRPIFIKDIQVMAYAYPFFTVRITCSSGTYIRSLLRDICTKLEIPGTMTQLARISVGPYMINTSITAEELMISGECALLPVDSCLTQFQSLHFNDEQTLDLKHGKQLSIKGAFEKTQINQIYKAYYSNGFLGLVKRTPKSIKVEKNIFL